MNEMVLAAHRLINHGCHSDAFQQLSHIFLQ